MKINIIRKEEVDVRYIHVECEIRYWEDGTFNGVEDVGGFLNPCRINDLMSMLIDVDTGQIENWKTGIIGNIHYKVCDQCHFTLFDRNRNMVLGLKYEGYVPNFLSPKEEGYGDYMIMDINENGYINKWNKYNFKKFIDDVSNE